MNSLLHWCSRKQERDECQLQLLMLMEAPFLTALWRSGVSSAMVRVAYTSCEAMKQVCGSPKLESIRILFLLTVVTVFYCLSLVFGFDFSLILLHLKSGLLLRLFRFLCFRLFGWEVPLLLLLCLVSGLGGYTTLHMQDPAGDQPAANPAAEPPSNDRRQGGRFRIGVGELPSIPQPIRGRSNSREIGVRSKKRRTSYFQLGGKKRGSRQWAKNFRR